MDYGIASCTVILMANSKSVAWKFVTVHYGSVCSIRVVCEYSYIDNIVLLPSIMK